MGRHAVARLPPAGVDRAYALSVEILLWLVPAAAVTAVAMGWASWAGRERRREVDPEVAARRMGKALAKELPSAARGRTPPPRDRSTGIAVRPRHAGAETRRTS